MACVAKLTAVSNPNVLLVPGRPLFDRLRHADQRHAPLGKLVSDGQGAVTPDRDQRIEAELMEAFDTSSRIALTVRAMSERVTDVPPLSVALRFRVRR
jgi:hypothetical protein